MTINYNVTGEDRKRLVQALGEVLQENSYPLFCAAKDLYLGTKHLTVRDLADAELISPKVFALICNAMAIRRFGLGAIQYEERNIQK